MFLVVNRAFRPVRLTHHHLSVYIHAHINICEMKDISIALEVFTNEISKKLYYLILYFKMSTLRTDKELD